LFFIALSFAWCGTWHFSSCKGHRLEVYGNIAMRMFLPRMERVKC
jgi:hypothetical protein